tara:strand:- start:1751 stop:1999 length:249 start_codon:yes stop_codon:yes gene_type:complete
MGERNNMVDDLEQPKQEEEEYEEEEKPEKKEESKEETELIQPFKLEEYGLVATVARNGLILLYEFKPIEDAKVTAQETFDRM